jgi:hypothetical protein
MGKLGKPTLGISLSCKNMDSAGRQDERADGKTILKDG